MRKSSSLRGIVRLNGIRLSCGHRLLPPRGYLGITLFGTVWTREPRPAMQAYLKTPSGQVFLNHERIHLLQARALGSWAAFYTLYIWYWLKLFMVTGRSRMAYRTHPFELEAYLHQHDFSYAHSQWKTYRWPNGRRKAYYAGLGSGL